MVMETSCSITCSKEEGVSTFGSWPGSQEESHSSRKIPGPLKPGNSGCSLLQGEEWFSFLHSKKINLPGDLGESLGLALFLRICCFCISEVVKCWILVEEENWWHTQAIPQNNLCNSRSLFCKGDCKSSIYCTQCWWMVHKELYVITYPGNG
jgi:hypothetical protein